MPMPMPMPMQMQMPNGCRKRVLSDLDTVDALTVGEVRSAAQTVFADSNMFTGLVLPLRAPKMTMELDLGV